MVLSELLDASRLGECVDLIHDVSTGRWVIPSAPWGLTRVSGFGVAPRRADGAIVMRGAPTTEERAPMSFTVSDLVVETVEKAGVCHGYGLPGDSLNGLTDALRSNSGLGARSS